jgi:hypothetical protein
MSIKPNNDSGYFIEAADMSGINRLIYFPHIIRHWHPLFSKYSTPQNISYKSTILGFVCLRTLSNRNRISSNASRLISLEYLFLIPPESTTFI